MTPQGHPRNRTHKPTRSARADWKPLTGLIHLTPEQAAVDLERYGDAWNPSGWPTRVHRIATGYQVQIRVPRGT